MTIKDEFAVWPFDGCCDRRRTMAGLDRNGPIQYTGVVKSVSILRGRGARTPAASVSLPKCLSMLEHRFEHFGVIERGEASIGGRVRTGGFGPPGIIQPSG